MNANQLAYALAKQVPDMQWGFVIQTRYGELEISEDLAPVIAEVVRRALLSVVPE
jgi:hypothetical protein